METEMSTEEKWKKVDSIVADMIEKRQVSSSDEKATRAVIIWMFFGPEEAQKYSSEHCKNLRENGFISEDGRLYFDPDSENAGVELILLVCGALGWIKCTPGDKAKEATYIESKPAPKKAE